MLFTKILLGVVLLGTSALAIPKALIPVPKHVIRATNSSSGLVSSPACAPDAPTGLSVSCWKDLNMSQYLLDWLAANGTAADCEKLGFAQCFLQWNGYNGLTCNIISTETCSPFDTANTEYESQQQFYALWNIYAIHAYVVQFSTALSNGQSLAAGTISKILLTVNPPKTTTMKHGTLGIFMNLSFALFGISSNFFPGSQLAAKVVFLAFIEFGKQSGTFRNYLTPTESTNNYLQETIQISELSAQLSYAVDEYQTNLGNFVTGVEGNLTEFLALASTGSFSQRINLSLSNQSTQLFGDLQLYVLNQAIQANSIIITKSVGVDPREIAKKTTQMSCESLDEYGVCSQFYYDANTTTTYSLTSNSKPANLYDDILQPAFSSGWATPQTLFVGAEGCQGQDPDVDAEFAEIKCVSNNIICNYSMNETAFSQNQFQNCPNQPHWGSTNDDSEYCFPASYLGSVLTSGHICYGPSS